MGTESRPNSDYTRTWFPSGEVEYATLADRTRLRYVTAGSGPALIMLHTVRTQLDHFQLVIPKLVDAFHGVANGLDRTGRPRATHRRVQRVRLLRRRQSSQSHRLNLHRRCTPVGSRSVGRKDG